MNLRLLAAAGAAWVSASCSAPRPPVRSGLEVLAARDAGALSGKRIGVVAHAASVDRELQGAAGILARLPAVELAAIFGPEHGATGAAQAGDKVAHARDPRLGIPVHSLYGPTRRPTRAMLEGLDVLVFDLQDVGCRAYTYSSTLVEVLAAAAEHGVAVWVLDRPNPLGGQDLEGPLLEPGRESFVGAHTVPLRHGLTLGELALLVNAERSLGADLRIVAMEGWRRDTLGAESGLPWVAPSPNLPAAEAAFVYPGFVLVEGTNLSEGRGTTLPFQLTGAPWLDAEALAAELNALRLPGCRFRPAQFTPTFSKHQGALCHGVQTHVTDPRAFRSVTAALAVIDAARRQAPESFRFLDDTFDRLAGTAKLRADLLDGKSLSEIERGWAAGLEAFRKRRERFLLYR